MKRELPRFNSPPIGIPDTFDVWPWSPLEIGKGDGLMANDFDIDGNEMEALLSFGGGTGNGNLHLHPDGSFSYMPDLGFLGEDYFMYYLSDGQTLSTLVPVYLRVGFPTNDETDRLQLLSTVFPNPGKDRFCIQTGVSFLEASLQVVDMMGREVLDLRLDHSTTWIDIRDVVPGVYLFNVFVDQKMEQHRILIQ